jgi:hypothetical protein
MEGRKTEMSGDRSLSKAAVRIADAVVRIGCLCDRECRGVGITYRKNG